MDEQSRKPITMIFFGKYTLQEYFDEYLVRFWLWDSIEIEEIGVYFGKNYNYFLDRCSLSRCGNTTVDNFYITSWFMRASKSFIITIKLQGS